MHNYSVRKCRVS